APAYHGDHDHESMAQPHGQRCSLHWPRTLPTAPRRRPPSEKLMQDHDFVSEAKSVTNSAQIEPQPLPLRPPPRSTATKRQQRRRSSAEETILCPSDKSFPTGHPNT